jgi:hypothetical protein
MRQIIPWTFLERDSKYASTIIIENLSRLYFVDSNEVFAKVSMTLTLLIVVENHK